ncbi:MAG: hypothetical protein ACOC2H_09755 [Spirochaetota bacterium]
MQIQNHIKLDGVLARNSTLRTLKQGDVVNVRILDRLDDKSAVIDLAGNRVRAHFKGGVPLTTSVRLMISGNSDGKLVFTVVNSEVAGEAARYFFLSASGVERYLSTFGGGITDVFQFLKRFVFRSSKDDHPSGYFLYPKLARKFSSKQVSLLSYLIGARPLRNEIISVLLASLTGTREFDSMKGELNGLHALLEECTAEEAEEMLAAMTEKRYGQLVVYDESGSTVVECVEDEEFVAVRFSLSRSGEIQIVSCNRTETIDVDIFIENDSFRQELSGRMAELDGRFRDYVKDVIIRLHNAQTAVTVLNRYAGLHIQNDEIDFKA